MLRDLALCLPDGRVIVSVNRLTIEAGTRTLLSRPSGSGKSTLFRAIAGIWPYGRGTIDRPAAAAVLLLPQRPYIPSGTLKTAVTYPSLAEAHSDEAVRRALELALLASLAGEIDARRAAGSGNLRHAGRGLAEHDDRLDRPSFDADRAASTVYRDDAGPGQRIRTVAENRLGSSASARP